MKLNKKVSPNPQFTSEGMPVAPISNFHALKRAVLTTFLWEDCHYEDGVSVVERIKSLIPKVQPDLVAGLAIRAREDFKLRHIPLLLVSEMAKYDTHKSLVAKTLYRVIQRPDELCELLSIYWANGKCPIANSIKKGLALAFTKFNEYSLAKYNQDNQIKLRDVLFLSHAKPLDEAQDKLWKKLINNQLETPITWETQLSASNGVNKKAVWEQLLKDGKIGALALLRNLRNLRENNVDESLIVQALRNMQVERVLPFRFIAAAKYYPNLESEIEQAMFKCVSKLQPLFGKTALIIDTSPSMWGTPISAKSDMDRFEAAAALSILIREICEQVNIYAFNNKAYEIPNRRGFALRDTIAATKNGYSKGSLAVNLANQHGYDRIICLTDGQWHPASGQTLVNGTVYNPLPNSAAYMLNVGNNKNGVGYTNGWICIDGFSEGVIEYINLLEGNKD